MAEGKITWLTSVGEVEALARRVLDPERSWPIICVTTPAWSQDPHVDMDALSGMVGERAENVVLPTGDLTWALSARLPERLDVYGGASRLWWPMGREAPVAEEHPLIFAWGERDSGKVLKRIKEEFARAGVELGDRAGPLREPHEAAGVVRHVGIEKAEIEVPGEGSFDAHSSRITKASGLRPSQVLRIGQGVRVWIESDGQASLLPFEADPWARVRGQIEVGTLVEGVVREFRNFGAFISLLPGAEGLVHRSQISDEWVSHPEDFLEIGQRVTVKVIGIEEPSRKVELSIKAVGAGERGAALSILEDGPGWLDAEPEPTSAAPDEQIPPADGGPGVREPEAEVAETAAEGGPKPEGQTEAEGGEIRSGDRRDEPQEAPEPVARSASQAAEIEQLERTIEAAAAVPAELDEHASAVERRIQQLRAEASSIVRSLQGDIAETRLRVLRFAEEETKGLVGSTEAALEEARAAAEELRVKLAATEADRTQLLERLEQERSRASVAELKGREARERLERESGERRELERSFDQALGGRERRFLRELEMAWEELTSEDDRLDYPWREPLLGDVFVESLDRVEGIKRSRVLGVCAHVVSGRAPEIRAMEVHALRSGMGGEDPQRIRSDGAKAYRCNLQTRTAAARRLHYWQLPDGRIELARVVYHDDFTI